VLMCIYLFGMMGLLVFKQFCVYNKEIGAVAMLVNLTIDFAMYIILFIAFPKATLALLLILEVIAIIQRRPNKNLTKAFTNVFYK
jgi:hypothetical protein